MIQLPAHVGAFCCKAKDRHSLLLCLSHDAQFVFDDNIIVFRMINFDSSPSSQYRAKLQIAYNIIFERFIEKTEQILKRCISNTYILTLCKTTAQTLLGVLSTASILKAILRSSQRNEETHELFTEPSPDKSVRCDGNNMDCLSNRT